MNHSEISHFIKYAYNIIDYKLFCELIQKPDDYWTKEQWPIFRNNPIQYLVTTENEQLFNIIYNQSKKWEG